MLQDPGEERVFLTAYERHQLELIEQGLADEDPRRPQETGSGGDDPAGPNPIWVALVLACGWVVLVGVAVTSAWLIVLGSAGASGAYARHRYERRRADTES